METTVPERGASVSSGPTAATGLPSGARLRALGPADAPAVATIAGRLGDRVDEAFWRRKLTQLAADQDAALGVQVDGRLVAYMLAEVRGGEFGLAEEIAFIELLGVEPAWQGRGLARALAETLLERFARRGVQRVLTLVNERDYRVRPFFRSLGLRQSRLVCLERRLGGARQ